MPDPLLALVGLTSLFAVGAGLKAVWHNVHLRAGGERPLGMFGNLVDRGKK